MGSELARRVVSAMLLAIVVLAATWYGGLAFRLLTAVATILIYYEWATIVGTAKSSARINFFGWIVIVCSAVAVVAGSGSLALFLVLIGSAVACVWGWGVLRNAWVGTGMLYAGLSGLALSAIRGDDVRGLVATLFIFAIVWATDVAAYFAGRYFAGPRLAPRISPSKTWSGAVGGALAGVVAGTAVDIFTQGGPALWVPLLALLLAISSEIGDLFESWIKRRFGAKDSSRLIPGHGGVMDRVDGLVFAAFAAYLAAVLLPVPAAARAGEGGFAVHFLAAESMSPGPVAYDCAKTRTTRI